MHEATERELAVLAQKTTARKGKIQVRGACSVSCEEEMAKMKKRLQKFEEFLKLWEPRLKQWDADYNAAKDESESASDSKDSRGNPIAEAIESESLHSKGEKQESGDKSSHSGSDESKSNSASESEPEDDEETVKETAPGKKVDRPESSNAAEIKDDGVHNGKGKTTKDVGGQGMETGKEDRSVEAATNTAGKHRSTSTVTDPAVTSTAKVPEIVPPKEVRILIICIIKRFI